jgi:uncharacterized protein YcbK (DUF882 family)
MITRRDFLKTFAAVAAVLPFGRAFASTQGDRILNLQNVHTGESLSVRYGASGVYDPGALDAINHLLRCHYTDEIKPVDVDLLDLLCGIKNHFGRDRQIHIVSGYRSPAYNTHLMSMGRRVASDSLHMYGLAIDFSIPGIGSRQISRLAKSLAAGGVGRYPQFVHIDVGPRRYW